MLLRIFNEVVVGLLIAGLVLAVAVPGAMRLGYETGPALGIVVATGSLIASIVLGERRHQRQNARDSS